MPTRRTISVLTITRPGQSRGGANQGSLNMPGLTPARRMMARACEPAMVEKLE